MRSWRLWRSRRVYAEGQLLHLVGLRGAQDRLLRERYDHLLKQEWLLPPLGSSVAPLRSRLHQLLLLAAFIEAAYIPFMVAFQLPTSAASLFELPWWLALLQWIWDLLFWVEILLMSRTTLKIGHAEDAGELVTDGRQIRQRYRRSGKLYLDILAVLPLEFLAFADSSARSRGALGCLHSLTAMTLRLNRLLHACRIVTYHGPAVLALSRLPRLALFWCDARPALRRSLAHASPAPLAHAHLASSAIVSPFRSLLPR